MEKEPKALGLLVIVLGLGAMVTMGIAKEEGAIDAWVANTVALGALAVTLLTLMRLQRRHNDRK